MLHLRWILPLVLVGLLQSCGGGSPTQSSSGTAADLSPGASTSWTVPGTPDSTSSVRLSFGTDSGNTYMLKVKGVPSGAVLSVVDAQGTPLPYSKVLSQTGKDSVTLQVPALSSGLATLVIVTKGGTVLTVSETVSAGLPSTVIPRDANEPDSVRVQAHALPLGTWTLATLHTGGQPDQDWFQVVTEPGWTYSFEVKDSIKLYASSITLFGRDSTPLSRLALGSADWPATSRDTLWIRVLGSDATGSRYRIRATRTQGLPSGSLVADSLEDDGTRATAARLQPDSSVQRHTLHGSGTTRDTDWVAVPVDSGRTYVLWLTRSLSSVGASFLGTSGDSLSLGGAARTASGEWVSSDTFQCVRGGTAFLRAAGSVPATWRIAVVGRDGIDSLHIPDPGESDDSLHPQPATAQNLSLLRRLDGNDTDWIALALGADACHDVQVFDLDRSAGIAVRMQGTWQSLRARDSLLLRRCIAVPETLQIAVAPSPTYPGSRIRYRVATRDKNFPADPMEPDQDSLHMSTLIVGAAPAQRWVMQGDEDWMQVHVDSGRNIAIQIDHDTALGNESLGGEVIGPDGYPADFSSDTYTRQAFLAIKKSGFLRVHVNSTSGTPQGYFVSARAFAWDSLERQDPMSLPADSTAGQALLTDSDVDGFDVPVQAGKSYGWSIRSQGHVGAFGYAMAPVGLLQRGGYGSQGNYSKDSNGIFTAAKDGTVRFYVENTYYRLSLAEPNSATLRVWPIQGDPFEADSTLATARTLKLDGTAITGTLLGDEPAAFLVPIDSLSRLHFRVSGAVNPTFYEVHDTTRSLSLTTAVEAEGAGFYFISDGITNIFYDSAWHKLSSSMGLLKLRGSPGKVGRYSISVTRDSTDGYEPDGFFGSAIPLGVVQSHTLTPADGDIWMISDTPLDTTYALTVDCARALKVYIASGGTQVFPTTTTSGTQTTYHFRTVRVTGSLGGSSNDVKIQVYADPHPDVIPYTVVLRKE